MKLTSNSRFWNHRHPIVFISLVILSILTLAVSASAKNEWIINEDALPFTPLAGAAAYWGVHAEAAYRMEVPENWNGGLVLSAHGYVAATTKTLSVGFPSLRSLLISQGYAWAASSYRANGYVPGTGALDTHRLIGLFSGKVGNPNRVYIIGSSLGGHVTGVAIEQWPNSFDGALTLCGVMGGNDLWDYFQDAYLVAETLAWGYPQVPRPADYPTVGWPLTRAELSESPTLPFPWYLSPEGQLYKGMIKNITGGERPAFNQGFTGTGLINGAFIFGYGSASTYGRDNMETIYRWTSPDSAMTPEEQFFNAVVWRSSGLPQYWRNNGLGTWPGTESVTPPINGTFRIPVVSLHTLGDMFVPFSMEQSFARRAAENGKASLLATRAIRGFSHCDFNSAELVQAWNDLVLWVEYGIPAAGDDVLNPLTVADPNFGCQFSTNSSARAAQGLNCP